jgi:SAM-dependent methyltransferase
MAPVGYKEPIYAYPYTDLVAARGGQGYRDALIIGAGSGSDVSYALHYGVERVDAVEIDPKIQQAGVQFHPAQPYASEQVSVHIDDGRAFMQRTERRYDLVIYALPDSIATLSGFANIRLESFLFTVESFRQARRLLREDGVLVLYNYYREPWLVDKLAGMLHEVFGRYPLQAEYRHPTSGVLTALAVGPRLGNTAWNGTPPPPPATDSWPFLYMRAPHLPPMYLGIMLLFVGCAVFGVMATGHARLGGLRENGVFFLMGAAFLLLETKSIIQFLLLFGSTWLVNSLVFFAILVSVLVANLIVQRFDFRRPALLFGLLFASLALMYLLPASALLAIEHPATRYVVASAVHFSPIFFANLAFGCMFRDTPKATAAFGWNIIGTMAGGALEYSSLAIGYRSLTLVVIALYLASFAWAYWALGARRPAG